MPWLVVFQFRSWWKKISTEEATHGSCTPAALSRHYSDVIKGAMASQITSLTIVYSTFYSGADQRKHQSSASLAFVRGIHRWPVNSPHKWPVTRKMFPFDDVIMCISVYHDRSITVWCHFSTANFLWNIHNRYPTTRPCTLCLFWL